MKNESVKFIRPVNLSMPPCMTLLLGLKCRVAERVKRRRRSHGGDSEEALSASHPLITRAEEKSLWCLLEMIINSTSFHNPHSFSQRSECATSMSGMQVHFTADMP